MTNKVMPAVGPILRRVTETEIVIWLALETEQDLVGQLSRDFTDADNQIATNCQIDKLQVLKNLWVYLIRLTPLQNAFLTREILFYDILMVGAKENEEAKLSLVKGNAYAYGDNEYPSLVIDEIAPLLTGSCRKPHTKKTDDFLSKMSAILHQTWQDVDNRPKALFLMGDQIYADDVSIELVNACQKLSGLLCGESYKEYVPKVVGDNESVLVLNELNTKKNPHYCPQFLKKTWNREKYMERCGFSSGESKNHLILFCEYIAMYLLVWNRWGWDKIAAEVNIGSMKHFVAGLDEVAKLLANVPTYMIFDDHDVTDDWNINRHWQNHLTAPGNTVVNNALAAYWIFQAWGNDPETFANTTVKKTVSDYCSGLINSQQYKQLNPVIRSLREQPQPWSYQLTNNKTEFVVFDIRTRRYKGEQEDTLSGLMQPEYLQEILSKCTPNLDTLVIVSPAPIFGFSKIEKLQGLLSPIKSSVTFADRENWSGDGVQTGPIETYDALLTELFTLMPKRLIVISGDVHYGFVKRGVLTGEKDDEILEDVCQVTSSALQNQAGFGFLFKLLLRFESLWYNPNHNANSPNLAKSDKDYILFYRTNFGLIDYRANERVSLFTLDDDNALAAHRI